MVDGGALLDSDVILAYGTGLPTGDAFEVSPDRQEEALRKVLGKIEPSKLRGLSLDNDRPESWRASGETGESPGRVPRTRSRER